ncbi:protein impA' [Marinobacterium nitratireducens]|uniref:Protein impA n=1 Tax=Marinobacterium nitratireducens TaxID=518897 RepID=A0A917Z6P1_9GAMM|nr:translesion error-prone DNA polymerase V autoproteolytic subunit [Marinobacterium nitratireducens]GGO76772.1 protein impA' [Marinobacterium nitratireducens]
MTAVILGRCGEPKTLEVPLFAERVSAGFPSPAQDYIERSLDLNELCIKRPAATFFVRAEGESMIEAGIFSGDILIVDRSLDPVHGDIVIASVDGEFTVKRLSLRPSLRLEAANASYSAIELRDESELEIFGVVTNVIHALR